MLSILLDFDPYRDRACWSFGRRAGRKGRGDPAVVYRCLCGRVRVRVIVAPW